MPTSKLELIQPIVHLIWQHRQKIDDGYPFRVLDVGPGWGKYGLLIREAVDPEATIDAIDLAPQATLIGIYNHVWPLDVAYIGSAEGWMSWATYDLVLLIDVIEHFDLADGYELIHAIDAPMILSTPATLFATPRQAPELPSWEQHHSLWSINDVIAAAHPRRVVFTENRYNQIVAEIG